MSRLLSGAAVVILVTLASAQSQAVELLVSGDFESPTGLPEIYGWTLDESVSGGSAPITNTAELSTGGPEAGTNNLYLLSFIGNGALGPEEGNFDNDNLPAGDVDGDDFLAWQRGISPAPLSHADLITWENNYGRVGGGLATATLSQSVPGAAGQTYTFSGWARWEDNYSGGVDFLDASSPLGAAPSPTTNTMTLQFLNSGGGVILEKSVDLLADGQTNLDAWQQHTVQEVAPGGTAKVRVIADAKDMVFNTDPLQAAFYDSFSLTGDDPNTELLTNSGLDDPLPSALDFWDLSEGPEFIGSDEILRVGAYQNHTPSGATSAWLSGFFGGGHLRVFNWPEDPVFGTMAQTVAIVGGGTYSFSGWSFFEQNYSGGVDIIDPDEIADPPSIFAGMESPTQTLITLEFLDPNGAVLSSSTIDVKADRLAQIGCGLSCSNNAANDATWYEHTFTGVVAPVGAVSARLSGKMIDGVFNTDPFQAAFFDDFSLDGPAPLQAATGAVPEPATAFGLAVGALMLSLGRNRRRTARDAYFNRNDARCDRKRDQPK